MTLASFLFLAFIGLIIFVAVTRFSIRATGGEIVFGIVLQLASCGCKHVDVLLGTVYLRFDFGNCKNKTEEIEP